MAKKSHVSAQCSPRMLYLAFTFAALSVVFNATILSNIEEVTAMLAH